MSDPEKELTDARQEAAHIAYALHRAEAQRDELHRAIAKIVAARVGVVGDLDRAVNEARALVEAQLDLDINATVGSVVADFARWRTGDFS